MNIPVTGCLAPGGKLRPVMGAARLKPAAGIDAQSTPCSGGVFDVEPDGKRV